MTKKQGLRTTLLSCIMATALLMPAAPVSADLLLMPIRVVLKDRDRTGNITLVNVAGEEAIYRMTWRYQRQNETGAYEVIETPLDPNYDLAKMIVFSPRQVTLPAAGKQRIRLSIRRPPDLPEGEYRAHLLFMKLGGKPAVSGPARPDRLAIGLSANVGYSLPVILRQGAYDAKGTLSNPQFLGALGPNNMPHLGLTVERSGKHSTLGRIRVLWTPPGAPEKQIGIMNNVNLFPEIAKRDVKVPLSETQITGGTIRIIYEGDGADKGILFDEKTFPVGG